MHWARKYISIPYSKMNCSKFVEHVMRDHFKIDYKFPQSVGSLFNQSAQLKYHMKDFTVKTETPKEGDVVLMNGLRRMCHIGMYIKIGRTEYVLHSEKNFGTAALHKLREIGQFGYHVEGYYTWAE